MAARVCCYVVGAAVVVFLAYVTGLFVWQLVPFAP